VVECWSRKNHYSNTPSLQLSLFAHLGHERLRIHDHAEVLVEVVERRLLFLPSAPEVRVSLSYELFVIALGIFFFCLRVSNHFVLVAQPVVKISPLVVFY
jgi:hypothetical protein